MAEAAPFAYDEVAYSAPIFPNQTPDQLGAAAVMHGLRAPAPLTASVLEIGCGDALNLIGMAAAAPQARFVGFDLSATAIATGRALVERTGLGNIELQQGDILTWPRDGAGFDYIICHGVYAWVPAAVRVALLELVGARLAPGGIAYVSYDSLPAAATKAAINRFLYPLVAGIADPAERVDAAVALVETLSRHQRGSSRIKGQLDRLVDEAPKIPRAYFYHDWLAEHYAPISVRDFAAAAGRAGLAFIGDASLQDLYLSDLDRDGMAIVRAFGRDRVGRNAALDMLRGAHMFRRDLLVRGAAPPAAEPDPLRRLSFAFIGNREAFVADGRDRVRFSKGDISMTTTAPAQLRVLDALAEISPEEMGFEAVRTAAGVSDTELRETLSTAAAMGLLDIHITPQPFVLHPGERPCVGALARAMIAASETAISLRHGSFTNREEPTRVMLALCDGTRTRAEIAEAMGAHYGEPVAADLVAGFVTRLARSRLFEA